MYIPKKFRCTDQEAIKRIIKDNAFASLSSQYNSKTIATHTPIYYIEDQDADYLIGHISKQNPQHHCFDGKQSCLAIFHGPHSYVSSSWYSISQAPTWNYISVHVTGTCSPLSNKEAHLLLSKMVNHYEEGRPNRFHIEDMPAVQINTMLNEIVAFKMEIQEIEAAFKLSQNRNDKDYLNIIMELEKQGSEEATKVAKEMRNWKK